MRKRLDWWKRLRCNSSLFHGPQREIFHIDVRDGKVTLRVPLDPSVPDELEAQVRWATRGVLDIRYQVDLDIEAELGALRDTFHQLYRSGPFATRLRGSSFSSLTLNEQQEVLAPIAAQGASIFDRLFVKMAPSNYAPQLHATVRGAVLSALNREQAMSVRCVDATGSRLFPWGLLYSDVSFSRSARWKLDPRRFWGFQHELKHDVEGTSNERWLSKDPKLVLAICPSVGAGPPSAFNSACTIPVANTAALGSKLGAFDGDILYFMGHAWHEAKPVSTTSYVELGGVKLYVDEIQRIHSAPRFKNPLVLLFLNGCKTAPLDRWDRATVAGHLCLQGENRACCVVTVAEVPLAVAKEFAEAFWSRFLAGERLGSALRAARLALLDAGNPLGLVYELFGQLDTRVGLG